jgi:drug/metabolite transporter (DMT)-like permease
MKLDNRAKGIQSALASAVFLGMAPIFGKQAMGSGFSPLALVFLRSGIAFFLILLLMLIFKRRFFYIFPVGLIGCVLAGVVNGFGSIFYYVGLSRIDASVGQLIYSFYPLFLALWLLVDRQPLRKLTILRLLLAVPGVILLISASQSSVDLLGAFFLLISAVLYALHLLINQRVLYEVPAPTVTLYTLLAMSVTVTISFVLFDRNIPSLNLNWWPVLGLAAITFISRITLFFGVKHLGGLQTAILGLGELLVTVVLAHWWLGESLAPLQWAGALLLILSIVLVGFDKYSPEKRQTSGILSWLNPPRIRSNELPWQSPP